MKVVIAGSRDIYDKQLVLDAIKESNFEITEIVSGGARGVDSLAIEIAREQNIDLVVFFANWGRHGKSAGYIRNKKMVDYVKPDGAVIAVWNGSSGTKHTIDLAQQNGLKLYIKKV